MANYKEVEVTFSEVPDEIALCINISGCPYRCCGCHSPHLQKDDGQLLTEEELQSLINANKGITCVCFMGGDACQTDIIRLSKYIKKNTSLKTAWYSGGKLSDVIYPDVFDYIKVGPYVKELGGLDSRETNQKFYRVIQHKYKVADGFYCTLEDITYKFWK